MVMKWVRDVLGVFIFACGKLFDARTRGTVDRIAYAVFFFLFFCFLGFLWGFFFSFFLFFTILSFWKKIPVLRECVKRHRGSPDAWFAQAFRNARPCMLRTAFSLQ